MSEIESGVLTTPPPGAARRPMRRRFYLALVVFMTLLIVAGFWPSYYGPLVRGAAQAPAVLHFHGVIYMGWMALLIVQVTLAARGKIRAHRALGTFGIGYGSFVFLLGLLVSFVSPVLHVNAGEWTIQEAAVFLPIPLVDMLLFGAFFGGAVAYRQRSEIHKRLMLLATIALLFAAAFRLNAAGMPLIPALALWFAPVVMCMVYDRVRQGRIHPVYWLGLAAMGLSLLRLPLGDTELWLGIGGPLFESLTA